MELLLVQFLSFLEDGGNCIWSVCAVDLEMNITFYLCICLMLHFESFSQIAFEEDGSHWCSPPSRMGVLGPVSGSMECIFGRPTMEPVHLVG